MCATHGSLNCTYFVLNSPNHSFLTPSQKTECLTTPIPRFKCLTHDHPHDMNNAPPPSSSQSRSQALPSAPNNNNIHGAISSEEEDEDNDTVPENNNADGGDDVSDTTAPDQRARRLRILKTIAFLDHLIRSFDLVVYCQISILYYMEYVNGILPISLFPPILSPTKHIREAHMHMYKV